MKSIAQNQHTGLRWGRIWIVVFAFALGISLIGLSAFKWIDDALLDIVPKGSFVYAVFLGALGIAVFWSLLIAAFAWLFEWALTLQTVWGWPRYFFYAFKLSEGEAIVGWTRITLHPSDGTLTAVGRSFQANSSLSGAECVPWDSEVVSGGTFRGHATCYILYSLNQSAAEKANRPYRDGLLRFRLLKKDDLKEGAKWPAPSQLGKEQYVGHQQAIDKDGVWNLAYAESTEKKWDTDKQAEDALTHELNVRRESLLEALASLNSNLKNPKG